MSFMRTTAALALGLLMAGPALAETTDPISVKVNMARILRISAPAATVIIGNPVADTIVSVVQGQSDLLTVYMGTNRTTMACEPICQPTIMLGDDNAYAQQAAQGQSLLDQVARPRQ
jgi:hypothetical protein